MIRKYHTHTLQTNPQHGEEEPQHTIKQHKASGRQLSKTLSLPHQDHRWLQNLEWHKVLKNKTRTKHRTPTNMGAAINITTALEQTAA